MGEKLLEYEYLFLALVGPCGSMGQFVNNFHQALIKIVHQTRLTFDLEIETTHGHSSSFLTRSLTRV